MQEIMEKTICYLFKEEYIKDFIEHSYIKFISDERLRKFAVSILKFYKEYDKIPTIDEYEKFVKEHDYHADFSILFQKLSSRNPVENYHFLIDQLKNEYTKEKFMEIVGDVDYKDINLSKISAKINKVISDIDTTSETKGRFIYEGVADRYRFVKKGGFKTGISSGFRVFDKHTGGFNKKELYLFVGRSGEGKSKIMFNLGYNLAKQYLWGINFSLEMYLEQVERMFDSREGGIDADALKYARVDRAKYKAVLQQIKDNQYPLYNLEHTGMTTPDFFINEVRKFKKKYPLDFIIIDYLSSNLVQSGLGLPTHEDLGMITKELKNLAKREDLIVITAAQSNRKSLEQADVGLENIGYSDMISHNCDFVAFIKKGKVASDMIKLKIVKNREGPKDIDMSFLMKWSTNTMVDSIGTVDDDGKEKKKFKSKLKEDEDD